MLERIVVMRTVGTTVHGLRAPIIREGDDLVSIFVDTVLNASKTEGFPLRSGDIVAVTEACVARAQGNYATTEQIAADVRAKFPGGTVGIVHPILSRNRFFILLQAIAKGAQKIVVLLKYPSDEVGNPLISLDDLDQSGVNPYADTLTEQDFARHFGTPRHPFTDIDYISLYKSAGPDVEIVFSNNPKAILSYTKDVLVADIHTRERTRRLLHEAGASTLYGLSDLLAKSVDGSGCNPQYGLYGSNMADDNRVKLFPRDGQAIVDTVAQRLYEQTGEKIEVLIFGDGAFKDPVAGIWELADPVVAVAYTPKLNSLPYEMKIKYMADARFADLRGEALTQAVTEFLNTSKQTAADGERQGTTPRRIYDLVGSLCDLTTGSGDKGTPFVHISGYFDHYGQ